MSDQAQTYDPTMIGRTGTTRHGERIIGVGPAHDPARISVRPLVPHLDSVEAFTPQVQHIVWDQDQPQCMSCTGYTQWGQSYCPHCGEAFGPALPATPGLAQTVRFLQYIGAQTVDPTFGPLPIHGPERATFCGQPLAEGVTLSRDPDTGELFPVVPWAPGQRPYGQEG